MRFSGIASFLTLLTLPLSAYADENLTLDLPPSRAQSTAATAPAENPDNSTLPGNASRAPLPSRSKTAVGKNEKVIGRLGVAAHATAIRAGKNSRRVLVKVPTGSYLALTHEEGAYYGVLMADQSTGWIAKNEVRLLNYEVVSPTSLPRQPAANLPGEMSTAAMNSGQSSLLQTAYRYLGIPYRYGGESANGIDCSAFVRSCFRTHGVNLPRTAAEQSLIGMAVPTDQLQTADRVYFANRSGRVSHTGIYIGNGYFIHASSSRHGVVISRLTEPLYQRMYVGARR